MRKNKNMRQPKVLLLTFLTSLSVLLSGTGRFIVPVWGQSRSNLDGEASGAITISDGEKTKTIKLTYAYATSPTNLYFTDKPLPDDRGLWSDYVSVMARDGKLNALTVFTFEGLGKGKTSTKVDMDSTVHSAACDCKDDLGRWQDISGSGQLERKVINNQVSGMVSSEAFREDCGGKQITIEYQVTFKATIPPDSHGEPAVVEDKPGMAYSQFYKAVIAEDAPTVKRLVASGHTKLFEGASAQKNIARLKSLIQPLSRVWGTHFYLGDEYARVDLEREGQGIEPRPKLIFKTKLVSLPPSPPSPPPPPKPRNAPKAKARAPRGGVPGGVSGGVPGGVPGGIPRGGVPKGGVPGGVPAIPLPWGKALMVLERGEWKVDWWMFFPMAEGNLISRIETYKTRDEAEKEIEEAYWRMDNGKPLPGGGGDPAKAYLAYCQAERAGNKRAMLKYLTGAQHDLYSNPAVTITGGATIWKEGTALEYSQIVVFDGEANDEQALLKVQAMRKGNRLVGRVMMIFEGGEWKVDKEDWSIAEAKTIAPQKRK